MKICYFEIASLTQTIEEKDKEIKRAQNSEKKCRKKLKTQVKDLQKELNKNNVRNLSLCQNLGSIGACGQLALKCKKKQKQKNYRKF